MKNIILIGMPGAGKSTIGVLLAKTLGFSFIDTDLIIQQNTGRLLQNIIDEDGLDVFCSAEERAICSVTAERDSVIATGGSAVYSAKAMEHLKSCGEIYYLSLPPEEIKARISNITTRGIAKHPGETIDDVFTQRERLYNQYADVTVDCHGKSLEETVEEICRCFGERNQYIN